jgi:1-acyl-sn-glycerol-3-phosphate acyltransferase
MKKITDRKSKLIYSIFSWLNSTIVRRQFPKLDVLGTDNIPAGPCLFVCNHTKRWDGLLIYHLLGRPSNFLVSPNELKGLQGAILKSMGAFPASTSFDLQTHVRQQLAKGEPVVIFPEGDIYRDGKTHTFKSGAARMALACAKAGIVVPIVPAAVHYDEGLRSVKVVIGAPVDPAPYVIEADSIAGQVKSLTERLFREVCHLRYQLGSRADQLELFSGKPSRSWVHPTPA